MKPHLGILFASSEERWVFLGLLVLFLITAGVWIRGELARERAERADRLVRHERCRSEHRHVRIVHPEHLEVQ